MMNVHESYVHFVTVRVPACQSSYLVRLYVQVGSFLCKYFKLCWKPFSICRTVFLILRHRRRLQLGTLHQELYLCLSVIELL